MKDPPCKHRCILTYWGLGLQNMNSGRGVGGGGGTIQLLTVVMREVTGSWTKPASVITAGNCNYFESFINLFR